MTQWMKLRPPKPIIPLNEYARLIGGFDNHDYGKAAAEEQSGHRSNDAVPSFALVPVPW